MIIVQTPLRVSLFGGGTDFPAFFRKYGGCVLSTAIDKYIFVTIKARFDDKLRVGYTKTEMVDDLSELKHELIRESLRKVGITSGVEVTTMGDIPSQGSGLGSSSTVTVGSLHSMYSYLGELVSAERLAHDACEIELDTLARPAGMQDQYIAAYGGLRFIEFTQNGEVHSNKIELPPDSVRTLNNELLLFYTGKTRTASTILREQNGNIEERYGELIAMKELVYTARSELMEGNIEAVGELLHMSWQLKKRLASKVSNGYLDDLYASALEAGATGGKVTGAGGGGFLLLHCPYSKQKKLRARLRNLQELPFNLEPDGSKVIFNYRR